MLIEVFADFSCPWCFIGRRRLARAQATRPYLSMQVAWRPFQLNPELPPQGVERQPGIGGWSGDERRRSLERTLKESGSKDGIRFAFDRIRRIPNTLAAHRLMQFVAGSGREEMMAEQLFSAYFEEGEDIGDPNVLIARAKAIGLEGCSVQEFLRSGAEADTVRSMDQTGRQNGVTGVPYFIFDRRYALAGAQEPASFLPLFDIVIGSEGETRRLNA